jgi:hypothetical protein
MKEKVNLIRLGQLPRVIRSPAKLAMYHRSKAIVERLEKRRLAATWTGAAGDGQWSNSDNWQGDSVPASGESIYFPSLSGNVTRVTIGTATTIGSLTMLGHFDLQGAPLTVTGPIDSVSFDNIISNLVLGQNISIDCDLEGKLFLGSISDGGRGYGIKIGTTSNTGNDGTVYIGDNFAYSGPAVDTYSGTTEVTGGGGGGGGNGRGELVLSCPLASPVQVDGPNGLLDGGVFIDSNPEVAGLTVGEVAAFSDGLDSSAGLDVEPSGLLTVGTFGTGTSALDFKGAVVKSGTIKIAGGGLNVYPPPSGLSPGTVLTLISNETGNPVIGTFAGLPQGSLVDGEYVINYAGGVNHQDVTLTVVHPITVASPAHASPNIVTGNSTTLTALGTTSTGSSGLTYHWGVVSSPAGAPKVRFSGNGIAAANRVVATFGKAGYYRLHCTISDGVGDTAATDVSVRVVQTATRLRLSPLHATVAKGKSIAIHATELDQFGHPLTDQASPTFSVANGDNTINPTTGLFTADTFGSALIQVEDGDLSATLGLQVLA